MASLAAGQDKGLIGWVRAVDDLIVERSGVDLVASGGEGGALHLDMLDVSSWLAALAATMGSAPASDLVS